MRLRKRLSFANAMSITAVFIALGGGAYAANELAKLKANSVGTRQIKANAVNSSKVKDGSLLEGDFKAGALPTGAKGDKGETGDTGIQGPAGSARAWGLVGSSGSVLRSSGVIGDATMPSTGVYCIKLSPTIDLDSSIVLTGADLDSNGTDPAAADKSVSEWSSDRPSTPCPTTEITVRTYIYNGDTVDDGAGGDTLLPDNESFTFIVP